MSSIYRKGRDGYYYYQSYEFNPKTGKKDKRIFHSLGTKDIEKAKIKQANLDYKYENKKQKSITLFNLLKNYKKDFITISITILITLFFSGYFEKKEGLDLYQNDGSYENDFSSSNKPIISTKVFHLDTLNKNIKEESDNNYTGINSDNKNSTSYDSLKTPKFDDQMTEPKGYNKKDYTTPFETKPSPLKEEQLRKTIFLKFFLPFSSPQSPSTSGPSGFLS